MIIYFILNYSQLNIKKGNRNKKMNKKPLKLKKKGKYIP
jgi:hypothetical protein